MSEVFTFVDASNLISKANLWEDRDELKKQKYDKLNNKTLPKVAKDILLEWKKAVIYITVIMSQY